jgi:hypothetical protein
MSVHECASHLLFLLRLHALNHRPRLRCRLHRGRHLVLLKLVQQV